MPVPEAGWYPDPQDGGRQRWWDGQGWTGQVRQLPSELSSPRPEADPVPGAPPVPVSGGGERSDSSGRWAWVVGILAVVVLAAAGGWWAAGSGSSEPVVSAPVEVAGGEPEDVGPDTGSDTAGSDGTGQAEQPPETDAQQWRRVAHDETVFGGDGGQSMYSVVAGGPGLVAVGRDSGRDAAAVWTSTDGTSWQRVPHDETVFGGDDAQQMYSVAAGGPGLVAVGADGEIFEDSPRMAAAVWTSP